MTEEEKDEAGLDDDAYVIEDTGESLDDFDPATIAASDRPDSDPNPEIERLKAENKSLKDQLLRKLADFDNFRKRTDREKQEYFRFALADLIRSFLPVLDSFERALASGADGDEFRRGVELIQKQLMEALQKAGVEVIDAVPAPFDPTFHEAITSEQRSDVPSHTVVEILQKGYQMQDRLLRPAMVKVAVGGPESEEAQGS